MNLQDGQFPGVYMTQEQSYHLWLKDQLQKPMTAIQDLIARVEKLEQFKTRLEAPMTQIQHLLMRVEELEKQAKHERFNDAMRRLNQDWEDADPIQAAVLAERERCAKVAEGFTSTSNTAWHIAAKIRGGE